MKNNFDYCLKQVLADEGGYSNDPSDSGGPTKYGITIADVKKYVKKNATAQDVKSLTVNQAETIYRSKYWDSLSCDDLASGVDYTCFDYGVNSGLGRPRKALQRFKSLKGIPLLTAINNERTAFLKALGAPGKKDAKFLKGWLARVARVQSKSEALAKKDNISGPVGGGVTVTTGVTLSQWLHNHEVSIIVGSIVAAIVIGTVIHLIRNKGK